MFNAFLSVERRITRTSTVCAGLMLCIAVILGGFQVVTRFILEQPAEWTEVLIRFALIWMVFLGIPEAFRAGAMVAVDFVHQKSPPRIQSFLELLIAFMTVSFLLVVAWYGWQYAQYGKVQTMGGLESVSMFWAYLAVPTGAVLSVFAVLAKYCIGVDERSRSKTGQVGELA